MRKYFLTGILAVICLAGSSYIVLESAGYYRKLYALAGLSGIMGWYTAVLSEIFQLALIILLPTGKENRVKQLTIVLIIALIYVMTVFAAGMNIGKPLIERWSRLLRQETLYGVLLEEQKSLSRQVELFNGQTQRLNTATSIQAQRDSFEEIKSHLKSADTVNEVLTQIELVA